MEECYFLDCTNDTKSRKTSHENQLYHEQNMFFSFWVDFYSF